MQKEIDKLRKLSGHEEGPDSWDWKDISKLLASVEVDAALAPDDLKTYLCNGLLLSRSI